MRKQRILGILVLVTLIAVPVEAGWISDFGRRLTEGAKNTIKNNLQNKVNKGINDVMDGKLSTDSVKGKKDYKVDPQRSKSGSVPNSDNEYLDTRVTATSERGKAIPYTGKYEVIDTGLRKFTAERIFDQSLEMGKLKTEVDQFLDPGYYLITITSRSATHSIGAIYKHEHEGISFGYGIVIRKKIYDTGNYEIFGGQNGISYIVEVLPNTQGHLELSLINNEELRGAGDLMIFRLPGPTLKWTKKDIHKLLCMSFSYLM